MCMITWIEPRIKVLKSSHSLVFMQKMIKQVIKSVNVYLTLYIFLLLVNMDTFFHN